MADGSRSQACEFSVCNLDFETPVKAPTVGEPWEVGFTSDNMNVIIVYLYCQPNSYGHRSVFVTDEDRRNGKIVIPADQVQDPGKWQIWLIGENKYGRLKKRHDVTAVKRGG